MDFTFVLNRENIEYISQNRTGQKQLYDYIYMNLFHIPKRYHTTKSIAEDIFNEAMIKIFNSLNKQEKIENVLAWSSKILFNTTIDFLRKEIKLNERFSFPEEMPIIESSMNSALDHLAAEEIFECIQSLPQNQLAVFSLFEIDGYSHKEISALLNISISNSKYLLHMAKKELRIKLQTFQIN